MTPVFADTFYFLALLDSREDFHEKAVEVSRDPHLHILTTEWVLAEFGDAYCHPKDRSDFVAIYRSLLNHPRARIVHADSRLFQRGVAFFEQRPDKEWSLTDCLSFVVMSDEGMTQALTGDKHFEQAASLPCSNDFRCYFVLDFPRNCSTKFATRISAPPAANCHVTLSLA